jgi:adenylylsulfate kinase
MLFQHGFFAQVLDGDNIRTGINSNLGFSDADRTENIRRIAEVSKLFLNAGIITLNCFVSPTRAMRDMARTIIGNGDFIEIYVNTPLEICEARDVKGLYAKARKGEIRDFTGIHQEFEAPLHSELEVLTEGQTPEKSIRQVFEFILPLIQYKKQ